jgi:hypothetical protein
MLDENSKLTDWQQTIRKHGMELIPAAPPDPWLNHQTVYAAGIYAGG